MTPEFDSTAGESFDAFYRREYPGQFRRSYLLLGSDADARDALTHAFTAVYRQWGEVDSPGRYLNRAVLNACRDVGRQRARIQVVPSVGDRPSNDVNAELNDALLALPYKQRAVVVLKHYVGLTEAEIADHLDIAPGSVGPTLHRAHKRLKTALKDPS